MSRLIFNVIDLAIRDLRTKTNWYRTKRFGHGSMTGPDQFVLYYGSVRSGLGRSVDAEYIAFSVNKTVEKGFGLV